MTSFWPYRLQMINSDSSLTMTQNVPFTFKSYILHKILHLTPVNILFWEATDASETFYDIQCLIVFFFVKIWKSGFSRLKKLNLNSIIFLSELCSFHRGPSLCFNNNVCFLCRGRTLWKSCWSHTAEGSYWLCLYIFAQNEGRTCLLLHLYWHGLSVASMNRRNNLFHCAPGRVHEGREWQRL